MGPPSSHGIPRVPQYSGNSQLDSDFKYEALTLFGRSSHTVLLSYPMHLLSRTPKELLPLVWPLSISLATTLEISVDFFSSPYLDVSVQAVPLIYLWIQYMIHDVDHVDCSIRRSADQSVLTTPRSLSQLTTSFIGS